MDVVGKIRSGARWLGAAKLVAQVYSWILTIFVMQILAPHDYALMAMAGVVMSFVSQFQELGVRVKLVQMQDYTHDYARAVYGLVLVSNSVIFILLLLTAPLAALFFRQDALTAIIAALALSTLISSMGSIPEALLKRKLDFRKLALVDIANTFVSTTTTLVMAWAGAGVWSIVYGSLFGAVVRAGALTFASEFRAWPSFKFSGLGDTLRFGGFVVLQRFVWWFNVSLDTLLIGRVYPAPMLGIYGVARQLATLPLEKVGSILNTLSFAGLARAADEMPTFRHYLRRSTKLVSLIMFPAFFGIAAISAELVPAVLGPKWEGLAPILAILALSAPGRAMTEVVTGALNSLGKPRVQLRCMSVTGALTALGIVTGLPFGLEQIAIGMVVASVVSCCYAIWVVSREAGMRIIDFVGALWQPTLASVTMLLVSRGAREFLPVEFPSLTGLALTVGIGIVVYCALIAILDRGAFNLVRDAIGRK